MFSTECLLWLWRTDPPRADVCWLTLTDTALLGLVLFYLWRLLLRTAIMSSTYLFLVLGMSSVFLPPSTWNTPQIKVKWSEYISLEDFHSLFNKQCHLTTAYVFNYYCDHNRCILQYWPVVMPTPLFQPIGFLYCFVLCLLTCVVYCDACCRPLGQVDTFLQNAEPEPQHTVDVHVVLPAICLTLPVCALHAPTASNKSETHRIEISCFVSVGDIILL